MKNIILLSLSIFLFSGITSAQEVTVKMTNELHRIQKEIPNDTPAEKAAAVLVKRMSTSFGLISTDKATMEAIAKIISWRRRVVRSPRFSEVTVWAGDCLILQLLQTEKSDGVLFGKKRECREAGAALDVAVDEMLAALEVYNNCLATHNGNSGSIGSGRLLDGIAQTLGSDGRDGFGAVNVPTGNPCQAELEALNAASKRVNDARTDKFFACYKS